MRDKINKKFTQIFTTSRHENIKMIVVWHKPAEIDNIGRSSAHAIYISCDSDLAF